MSAPADADVLILCGGLGTRLRSVVGDRAKPMADVGGKPFLEVLVDHFARSGFRRFVLCVGHRADTVRAHFRGSAAREFVFSEEPEPRGTAGAVKLAAKLCRPGTVLAMNGDSLCPLDPLALLDAHARRGAAATIAAAAAGGRRDAGGVEFDDAGRVTAFREKEEAAPARVNAGVYALEPAVLASIPEGRAVSLERETFPAWIGRGLCAFPTDRPLYDIGTPERLEAFRRAYAAGLTSS